MCGKYVVYHSQVCTNTTVGLGHCDESERNTVDHLCKATVKVVKAITQDFDHAKKSKKSVNIAPPSETE
jgi:hypothetical protein